MVAMASMSAATVEKSRQQVLIFVTTWIALIHFLLVFKFAPYSRKVESRVNKLAQFVLHALLLATQALAALPMRWRGWWWRRRLPHTTITLRRFSLAARHGTLR